MGWLIEQWGAFADWSASQHVLVQIVIGSLVLLAAYACFVFVLRLLGTWLREPVVARPGRPGKRG